MSTVTTTRRSSTRPSSDASGATPRAVKVLHVFGRMDRGGAEVRTVELMRNIDRDRFHFDYCSLSGRPGEMDDEVRSLGATVHLLDRRALDLPRRFRELLRREQYDVVHAHLQLFSGYLLRLAASVGTPVRVAHFRSSHDASPSTPARRLARIALTPLMRRYATHATKRRWVDRHATHVLGVSEHALARGWNPDWKADPRCQVVYDGLQPRSYTVPCDPRGVRREFNLPGDGALFIHVGRMTEAKNHVRLMSIFAEVLRRRPEARLLLVGRTCARPGDHSIERQVRERMQSLGSTEKVVFCGERTDVARLLKAADVLLFPSLWEGLGDVVLEACVSGTPAVCSDLPSIGEIADRLDGVNLLSLDDPNTAWASVAAELADRSNSETMRAAAFEQFTQSVFHVDHGLELLCQIWASGQPATSGANRQAGGPAHG